MASVIQPERTEAFCGYVVSGETQCPDLEVLFPDRCPTWCGAETYAQSCTLLGSGTDIWIGCGVIE